MQHASRRRRRTALGLAVCMASSLGLAACSSEESGPPTLTWYINPDVGNADPTKGGQATLAQRCTQAAGGKYKIKVQLLPNDASDQRTQLLRRLAAGDGGMDIMSVDPAFLAEFASADYLAPVPQDMQKEFTEDRVQSSIDGSTYRGKLVAVPMWANTQLLWYKKSVAKKAGLDMTKPVTWDQLIGAAQKSKTTIGVQSKLYEGYAVWINALIAGAGGKIVQNPGAGFEEVKLGVDSPAGKKAAGVISKVVKSGVGGPAMGSSDETASLDLFISKKGGFLVNWPYTYGAYTGDKKDVGAAVYPRTDAGVDAKPPFGGIELAVGKNSKYSKQAYEAIKCITGKKNQADYMVASGNPASRKGAYEDAGVKKAFPNGIAALIRTSLDKAEPRPLSPAWGDISTGLQQKFSPPGVVNPQTPATAQKFILDVLKGEALL